jgi:hypothetical protein
VLAVVGEQVVVGSHCRHQTGDGRFLAEVQVTVTADLGLRVRASRSFLEPANEDHLSIEVEE